MKNIESSIIIYLFSIWIRVVLIDNITSHFYCNVQNLSYKMETIIKTYNYFGLKFFWFDLRGFKKTHWCKNKKLSTIIDDNEVFEFVFIMCLKIGLGW
jgi:hypothetical protein